MSIDPSQADIAAERYFKLPLWFCGLILLCTGVFGFMFGRDFDLFGKIVGGVGGVGVGLLWLRCVDRMDSTPIVARFARGLLYGSVIGVIHLLLLVLPIYVAFEQVGSDSDYFFTPAEMIFIGVAFEMFFGAMLGLGGMVILEIYRAVKWQELKGFRQKEEAEKME